MADYANLHKLKKLSRIEGIKNSAPMLTSHQNSPRDLSSNQTSPHREKELSGT